MPIRGTIWVLIDNLIIYLKIAEINSSKEQRRNGVPGRVDPITTCGMVVNASPRN